MEDIVEDETPQGGQDGNPKTVAWDHFHRVRTAKSNLETQVSDFKGQVGNLSSELEQERSKVQALTTQLQEMGGRVKAAETRFTNFQTAATELGTTDPDVIETALMFHQRAGEDAPPLKDWLGGFKEDPSTAPTPLRGLFQPQDGTQAKVEPRITGNTTSPNAPAQVTAEALRAAREKATATGDWSDWSALVKAR